MMKKYDSVQDYFMDQTDGRELMLALRKELLKTELVECLKWNIPCYTINNKNVIGIASFKNHISMWFYNGSFLKDEKGILINAQEGKTRGLRQWRFNLDDNVDVDLLSKYIKESIQNQHDGKVIKADKTKEIEIPIELSELFKSDSEIEEKFKSFTKFKQREFAEHVSSAKREATRLKRLEKIKPMIINGIGLNDKYRK